MLKNFLFFIVFLFFAFSVFADESLIQIKQKLKKIERDISDIQKTVFSNKKNDFSENNSNQNAGSEITVFDMRLRDIESELQSVNLNYENISFEIDDLKKTLNNLSLELSDAILAINTKITNNTINNKQKNSETNTNEDLPDNTLGSLKINSSDLSDIDDTKKTNKKIIYDSPEKQFQAAFDNLRNQKFEEAKYDLEIFIKEHDQHRLAGSANYWLGEIYLLQKEYREAALVFAEAYQKYPESVKSPDSLFKLAETLVKIEKKEEACDTLNQFTLKYPNNKLIDQTKLKINELQCS